MRRLGLGVLRTKGLCSCSGGRMREGEGRWEKGEEKERETQTEK